MCDPGLGKLSAVYIYIYVYTYLYIPPTSTTQLSYKPTRKTDNILNNPLPPQIINDHIPPHHNPPPSKPPHLAPMRTHHRLLRPHVLGRTADEKQPPRTIPWPLSPLPPPRRGRPRSAHASQHRQQHRDGRVEGGNVFPHQRRRRQRVQRDGTGPAGVIAHQGAQEGDGAVVEAAVVGVAGDAVWVEGDEDVDG